MNSSLNVVIEGTGRWIVGVAPFGHPVVWDEVAAARKLVLKDLPVVVGFFGLWNNTRKLRASLSKHLPIDLKIIQFK